MQKRAATYKQYLPSDAVVTHNIAIWPINYYPVQLKFRNFAKMLLCHILHFYETCRKNKYWSLLAPFPGQQ